jgi:thiamine biosynthesis protein ThiI
MNFDLILVRFGEITIKGRNRNRFEKMLFGQMRTALEVFPMLEYERTFGRVYIHLNGAKYAEVASKLKDIFGILSFSPVVRCLQQVDHIRQAALEVIQAISPAPKTFKVSVKRAWKQFPHNTLEMNQLIGGHVLRHTPELKVDVRTPEVELKIDIQFENTYVYCQIEKGAGGFPLGMNGKAMLLLSGGIDSPVAGWLALRKGLDIEAVHFHSYPFTSEQAKEKVITLTERLAYYSGNIKLHLVPFTDIQTTLTQTGYDSLIITLMRRYMLRITEALAEKQGALAIVSGESLGQVASQTLGSMNVIGRTSSLPLLRPLIMMDKQDIIDYAVRIGTFETSILPFEDCCTLFVPKNPAINPNLKVVERVEGYLKDDMERLIEVAIRDTETIVVTAQGVEKMVAVKEDEWF